MNSCVVPTVQCPVYLVPYCMNSTTVSVLILSARLVTDCSRPEPLNSEVQDSVVYCSVTVV